MCNIAPNCEPAVGQTYSLPIALGKWRREDSNWKAAVEKTYSLP